MVTQSQNGNTTENGTQRKRNGIKMQLELFCESLLYVVNHAEENPLFLCFKDKTLEGSVLELDVDATASDKPPCAHLKNC